jgi:hypothetical protein
MQANESTQSSYMLIFRETGDTYKTMAPEERQKLLEEWNQWVDRLAAEGKLLHGHPLKREGRIVSGTRGATVIDGPYTEGKEAVGGYFLLRVDTMDEAIGIAKMCPSLPHGLLVEVRPVAERCPVLSTSSEESAKVLVGV